MPRSQLRLAVLAWFVVALTLPALRPAPPDRDLDDLGASLAEVAAACPCARRPRPAAWPRVLATLERNPLVLAAERGELPGLQREAAWLSAGGQPRGPRSEGDRRFVHGFLHRYLATLHAHAGGSAPELAHREPPEPSPRRELAGLEFEDFLGLLD